MHFGIKMKKASKKNKVTFQPIIGLEIHIELNTKSKMFCGCRNDSTETRPNFNTCAICLGHPGTLPVINKRAVEMVVKTGLALSCEVNERSYFERKSYFYPDLPKGFQISQYRLPLCKNGSLQLLLNRKEKKVGIERIHLEEDTGKLIHPLGQNYSLVDFNRSGIPLMELVTHPNIQSGIEARKFCEELQLILRYLGVSNADMEKGQMRCEVNISLAPQTNKRKKLKLGTKVEIKNLNSFRSVERTIDYEIKRQSQIIQRGGGVIQETRGWDDTQGSTKTQRQKEEAHDYRYFPEPDLPIIQIKKTKSNKQSKEGIDIQKIKSEIPELPWQKRKRFEEEYQIPQKDIEVLIRNKELADYFEKVAEEIQFWMDDEKMPLDHKFFLLKLAVNYLITDLVGLMEKEKINFQDIKMTPENFAELVIILHKGEISSRVAKDILYKMVKIGIDPSHIIDEGKLKQVSDKKEIERIAFKIIEENKKAVEDYKKGKENSIQFLIGQMMKETKGKINPKEARRILQKYLDS